MMHSIIHSLSNRLARSGMTLEYEHRPRLFQRHSPSDLERLTRRSDTAAWELMYATEEMQRWFEASGVPCVIHGRLFDGVRLSSVYFDNEAVAGDAARLFHKAGHRDVVHLMDTFTSLADRLGAQAFREEIGLRGMRVHTIEHDPSTNSVKRAVNTFLSIRPRPTAVYVTNPDVAVTVLGYLIAAGFKVPQQIEMIAGWCDPILLRTVPEISHYELDGEAFGKRLAEMVLECTRNKKCREHKEQFKFRPGGTTR